MKNSETIPNDLIAPTIKPKEARQRIRKLGNLLRTASVAIQSAEKEFHYLIYGIEGKSRKENHAKDE
uniref:Uncharacterized protein n=1 Tax=Candidatus Kentrum sp. LFY TaxID=2126342 RepID=A0A450U7W4_9GAMM|nr:MAG: hypothetical protein BECKLFY1418A_GA0070994_10034 [Candidatus Kentron sp. LFY]VFJ99667.1 MAG: hypothetical protein BECKLFY1418B_GA0070995_11534 [Candidatus Kentron sp. LFY]